MWSHCVFMSVVHFLTNTVCQVPMLHPLEWTPSFTLSNKAKHGEFFQLLCLKRGFSINSFGASVNESSPLDSEGWSKASEHLEFSWRCFKEASSVLFPPAILFSVAWRSSLPQTAPYWLPTWRKECCLGRSLAFRNKPHCSLRSHAFLPPICLLQPLTFCLCCSFSYNARAFPAFLSPR